MNRSQTRSHLFRQLVVLHLAAAVVGVAGALQAGTIPVPNFSFENPPLGPNGSENYGVTSTWIGANGGPFNPGLGTLPAPADGVQELYINGGTVYQDIGSLLANTTYTLTVALGNRSGFGGFPTIELVNGSDPWEPSSDPLLQRAAHGGVVRGYQPDDANDRSQRVRRFDDRACPQFGIAADSRQRPIVGGHRAGACCARATGVGRRRAVDSRLSSAPWPSREPHRRVVPTRAQ